MIGSGTSLEAPKSRPKNSQKMPAELTNEYNWSDKYRGIDYEKRFEIASDEPAPIESVPGPQPTRVRAP